MATEPKARYTYEDLAGFPEDNLRREIIDGELIVTPAPGGRHQDAVRELTISLGLWSREHGGKVYPAPRDVFFTDSDVVEPDVVFVGPDHLERVEERFVRGAPDVAVEVSSPSTRRLELHRKRDLYEKGGVTEYWYVDLDSDRVEVYRLRGGAYGSPVLLRRGEIIESPLLPGLAIPVEEILGPPDPE
jgi:Uma2 family endonuclease